MAVYKDEEKGTWRVIYRYTDWAGKVKQTQKRGFKTRREAQQWERETMLKKESKPPCPAFGTTINETWRAEGC